jgi:hypothetical protein
MAERLLIVGTGGYAKEVAQIARRVDPRLDVWKSISYVAASPTEIGQRRLYGTIDCSDADLLSCGDGGRRHRHRQSRDETPRRFGLWRIADAFIPNLIDHRWRSIALVALGRAT